MKTTVRLVGALWLAVLVVLGAFALQQVGEERNRLTADLERRASLLGEGLKETLEPMMGARTTAPVERLVRKFSRPNQRLAVYDRLASPVVVTPDLAGSLPSSIPEVTEALDTGSVRRGVRSIQDRTHFVFVAPLVRDERVVGAVAVFLDASHLEAAEWRLWEFNAIRFVVLAVVVSAIAALVVWLSISRPMARMAEWTKTLKTGKPMPPPAISDYELFAPLASEVTGLARSLHKAQQAAEQEAALRLLGDTVWTEERLKQFVNLRVGGPLFVVSNREPVSHVWENGQMAVQTPASGLVTAMEPVLRACGGVWVAHGSGSGDREAADERGRIGLPIDDPRYTLRRVWLTREEEEGYYYGFSNEGLWPLCHIVHTRPLFRPEDWVHYQAANRKFADALLDEMEGVEAPLVLIQDYHFALLPAYVKEARPDARVAIFWHIPWPNFEAFGICPWQHEILAGMLGADIIGFHTQYHCNNFLETVERVVESRIDWEHFTVTRGPRVTRVKPFPISVDPDAIDHGPARSREQVLAQLELSVEFFGIGVERVDYTKGLPERFRALGRFFERYPEYVGRMTFVQVASPSRSQIKRYQELVREVAETVKEVNGRLQTRTWRPIVYLDRHHDRHEILPLYRHADFCMVTSLHDGMNLVAKEFVAAREDEEGVLVLSRFTGAARELTDAVMVNPYDLDEMAEAVRVALAMPREEQRARMTRMRRVVREHNIYRWAGLLLNELSLIPEEAVGAKA
ncbi:MAG TPA: trehalose-6-phosphate synthase [Candidatus Binatia bacterium]|nr:trehalose-6-phosphate synthase [Candidatus Binatia bacterium]